jgi:excisionase family DNA binding protein
MSSTPNRNGWISNARAGEILQVSPKTISRWAKEGKLPFMKTLGGHRRFREAEIRELAATLVFRVEQ